MPLQPFPPVASHEQAPQTSPDILTPEDIQALVSAGQLSLADMKLLHPDEAKIALPLLTDHPYGQGEGEMGAPLMPPGFVGALAGAGSLTEAIKTALGLGSGGSRMAQKQTFPPGMGEGMPQAPKWPEGMGQGMPTGAAPSLDSRITGLPPSDGPSTATQKVGPEDAVFQRLLKALGGKAGNKQSPLSSFDEADKRKVMFGGAGDQSRPQDRSPVKKASVMRRKPAQVKTTSHGTADQWNGRTYDTFLAGDAQTAASRDKGRAMRKYNTEKKK